MQAMISAFRLIDSGSSFRGFLYRLYNYYATPFRGYASRNYVNLITFNNRGYYPSITVASCFLYSSIESLIA